MALEGPLELGLEPESFVGQPPVGRLLVFGLAASRLDRDAVCPGQIPDQVAPERAVVGPSELAYWGWP